MLSIARRVSLEHPLVSGLVTQNRLALFILFSCRPWFPDSECAATTSHPHAWPKRPWRPRCACNASFSVYLSTSGRNGNSAQISTEPWNGVCGVPVAPQEVACNGVAVSMWFWLLSRAFVSLLFTEMALSNDSRSDNSCRRLTRHEWSSRPGMRPRPDSGLEPSRTCRPLKSARLSLPSALCGMRETWISVTPVGSPTSTGSPFASSRNKG